MKLITVEELGKVKTQLAFEATSNVRKSLTFEYCPVSKETVWLVETKPSGFESTKEEFFSVEDAVEVYNSIYVGK